MAVADAKLRALQRTISIQEDQLGVEAARIRGVVEERKTLVAKLEQKREAKAAELKNLRGRDRTEALHAGDARRLAGMTDFAARVVKQIEEVEAELAERKQELQSAQVRMQFAETELVAVRLEKKRIEKLLDSRESTQRIKDAANEEALTDEMNVYRGRRKED